MDPAQSASDREFPRPDAAFAFACGLYTASVITPITAILAQAAVSGTGRLVLAVLSIGTALVAVGTVGTTRLPGLPEYLGATPWAWLLVVAPLVGTASVLASAALPSVAVARSTTVVVGLAGLGSAFAGLAVVATATTRHTAWVLADATVEATWTAGWPTRTRRRLWTIAGMVVLVGAGTFVAGSLREQYLVELAGQVLVPVGLVTATAGRRVTYRATERGLELRTPLARRLLPWSAFDGYRRTDDAIVLSRSAPWRVSIRCAVDDVADPETVLAALSAHLDRES